MVIIITDHHIPCDTLPHAHAIVNPHLKNCKFHSKNLSGSGVAFYLMLALREALIQSNWFKINQIKIPKLAEFLDLVALGTISDCMPLDLNNRILVYQGLQRLVLYHQDWHEGSARSIEEINIRNVLCELDKLYPKLIVSFGGHKTAAGLVIQY
uniref:DDH domain-containing protein n=1 Tax=Glossina pallidipes TaxID=7398 RepID=A0A1A9Z1K8_GLOPL